MEKVITFENQEEAQTLFGNYDQNLRYLRETFKVSLVARNETLRLEGDQEDVQRLDSLVNLLREKIRRKEDLSLEVLKEHISKTSLPPTLPGPVEPSSLPNIPGFKPYSSGQKNYVRGIQEHDIVFSIGPAGTGKTYIAVVMASSALRQGKVQRIVLVRPAVEAGEKLGFLPGDFYQKVNPYLRPLYDALNDTLGAETVKKYMEKDVIEVIPLAYMRGRTLNQSFIILDEAQNTTTGQMKMFLTRMGEGSKIVVTGDVSQIDIPDGKKSGLVTAPQILKNIPGILFTKMTHQDIVRNPLVEKIVKAYESKEA